MPVGTEPRTSSPPWPRAREVQQAWAATPVRDRAAVLLRYHDLVLDRQDELLDLIQAENGKARVWAFEEIMDQAVTARYYARLAPRALKPQRRLSALPGLVSTREHHVPKGVVGVISPWNYPLVLAVSDALAALVAGNGIVIKPDSQTPFTALRAFELLEEAGLPAGLVQVVTGPGRSVGTAIIESADYMMFTGLHRHRAHGRPPGRRAPHRHVGRAGRQERHGRHRRRRPRPGGRGRGGRLLRQHRPALHLDRAPLRRRADRRRLHSTPSAPAPPSCTLGAEQAYGPEVGALASQDQLDKVRAHVDDAVAKGARVVAGGRHRPDVGELFYEPTVLAGVTPDMALYREETFGPVVAVYPVASDDEAVAQVNDTEYGLNASVYCGDTDRGKAIAERIRAGTVNVNDGYSSAWASLDAPMGGMKASGLGRRHGREGLLKYTESQTVAVRSALAAKLQDPGRDGAGYARRFTAILRKAKHLPR